MNKEEQTTDETTTADTDTTNDPTVTSQEQNIDTQTASEMDTATEPEPASSYLNVLAEIKQRLGTLQELFEKQNAHNQEVPSLQRESAQMEQRLTNLHELFDKQIVRNQNQKQMFDTIYREMTSYKEDALLDAYHKPIIHNLIQLYDNLKLVEYQFERLRKTFESLGSQSEDTSGIFESFRAWFSDLREGEQKKLLKKIRSSDEKLSTELERAGKEPEDKSSPSQAHTELTDEPAQSQEEPENRVSPSQLKGELSQFQVNLENVRFELEEVLYRMDVNPYEEHPEKLDPKLHKTAKMIPADDLAEDRRIVDTHKIGFYWREKVFRPAEVTISRYTQPAGKPEETVAGNPKDERGDETDG